jgi:cytochrome b
MSTMRDRETTVWDIVTRVFHWSLVVAFCTAQLTAEEWDPVHEYAGYVVLSLVAFRVVWGLVGPQNVQFREFIKSAMIIMTHMANIWTGRHTAEAGHNPAGGAMVMVLLAWLALTGLTGWLSVTVSGDFAESLEELHEFFGEFALLLILAHITGVILMSFVERQDLATSMIDGKKYLTKKSSDRAGATQTTRDSL